MLMKLLAPLWNAEFQSFLPHILSLTSDTVIDVAISAVTTTNGASIISYAIYIDDGLGGAFVEL